MADFLAQGQYLPYKSTTPDFNLNTWASIAEMGFKQSMMMHEMLDKSYQTVLATKPTIAQDKKYVKDKMDNLNKQIESFTGSGSFIAPHNMGKIRQLMREHAYDPELMAINQRTEKINEVYKRINDEKLPASNYYDFISSLDKANEEFAVTGKYDPNININYTVTPYSNISKKMMTVVSEIDPVEISSIRTTQDGMYHYIETTKGRSPQETLTALIASLDSADLEQIKAEYNYAQRTNPESLEFKEDVKNEKGEVLKKAGTTMTLNDYLNNEVLKIAAAVTGQSTSVNGLTKTMQAELFLMEEKFKHQAALESIKQKNKDKEGNGGITDANIASSTYLNDAPVVPPSTGQYIQQTSSELQNLEKQRQNLESIIKTQKESGNYDISNYESQLASTNVQIEIAKNNLKSSTNAVVGAIGNDELVRIYSSNQGVGYGNIGDSRRQYPLGNWGSIGVQTNSYVTSYEKLNAALTEEVNKGTMTQAQKEEILNSLPIAPKSNDSEEAELYASKLLLTDLKQWWNDLSKTEAYSAWDKTSYRRGSVASNIPSNKDELAEIWRTMDADRQYIERAHAGKIEQVNRNRKIVSTAKIITSSETYADADGTSKKHPVFVLNESVTNSVRNTPQQWIDVETGKTLDLLIKTDKNFAGTKTVAAVTDTFLNGHQLIQITLQTQKTSENQVADQVRYVYNTADPYKDQTRNVLKYYPEAQRNYIINSDYYSKLQGAELILEKKPSVNDIETAAKTNNFASVNFGESGTSGVQLRIYKLNDKMYMMSSVKDGKEVFSKDPNGKNKLFMSVKHAAEELYNGATQATLTEQKISANKAEVSAYANQLYQSDTNPRLPEIMTTVIGLETGGSYSPSQENKSDGKALGLIQFYPDKKDNNIFTFKRTIGGVTKNYRYTREQMVNMSIEEQMKLTKDYFKSFDIDPEGFTSVGDAWLAIFLPGVYKHYSKNKAVNGKTNLASLYEQLEPGKKFQSVINSNPSFKLNSKSTVEELINKMNILANFKN